MIKTVILVSGGGTNLQAVMDAHLFGEIPNCELTAVISSDPEAYALVRARSANIPAFVIDRSLFPNAPSYNMALLQKLHDLDTELVVLAGYAYSLSGSILRAFAGRIISTFPSLLPAFAECSEVTEEPYAAAIRAGVKISGATACFVSESGRPIILQQAVEVWEGDTTRTLQRRIMEEAEWKILPRAIALFCQGELQLDDTGIVHLLGGDK